LPQNEHFRGLGISQVSSLSCFVILSGDFPCFSLSFPKHQHILNPNRTLNVPRYDSALILSFQNANTNLTNFASHAGTANYLDDF
jgi:hypothetical protein